MNELTRVEIVIKIKDDLDRLTGQFDKLDKKAKQTEGTFTKLGRGMKTFFSAFTKLGRGMTTFFSVFNVGVAIISEVGDAIGKLIKPAVDFVEVNNKFNLVYKDIKKTAQDTMDTLRREYKLSKAEATEYLANIGHIFTWYGLSQKAALELSNKVVRLSTDLSSFANIPIEQAVNAMTKALIGEIDALESLGVALSEEQVNKAEVVEQEKLLQNGFRGTQEELKRTARAYATMNLITEQSKNAMGDFNCSLDESSPNTSTQLTKDILQDYNNREKVYDIDTLQEQLDEANNIKARGDDGGSLLPDEQEIYDNFDGIITHIQGKLDQLNMDSFKKNFNIAMDGMKQGLAIISNAIKTFFENQTIALNQYHEKQRALLEAQTEAERELAEFKREQELADFKAKYGMNEGEYLQMEEGAQREFEAKQSVANQEELLNLKAVRSRKERNKQIAELDKQKAEKEKEIKSKQFEANKAEGIIGAIINTAQAIMRIWADVPKVDFGISTGILTGIAAATGAAQVGTIAAQKNPYAYERGGIAMTDQFSRLGELGPELVLPTYLTKPLLELGKTGGVKGGGDTVHNVESYDNREYNVTVTAPTNYEQIQREFRESTGEDL